MENLEEYIKKYGEEQAEEVLIKYYTEMTGNSAVGVDLYKDEGEILKGKYYGGLDEGNKVVELNLGNASTSGELLEVITHEGVHAFEDNKEDDEILSNQVSDRVNDITDYEQDNNLNIAGIGGKSQEGEREGEGFLDQETREKLERGKNGKLIKYEIEVLASKFNVDKEEVIKNQLKYVYYEALEKNPKYKDKKAFEKQQKKLEGKIAKEEAKKNRDEEKIKELKKGIFTKVGDKSAIYHNVKIDKNDEPYIDASMPNEKYVNINGEEAVFNKKSGAVINDGINNATYNTAGFGGEDDWKGGGYHLVGKGISDVGLWVEYGVGPNDKLTKEERKNISGLMNTLQTYDDIAIEKKGKDYYKEQEKVNAHNKKMIEKWEGKGGNFKIENGYLRREE